MIELEVVGADRPALVDDQFSYLIGYRWRMFKDGYVGRKAKGKRIYLHHVVMPGKRYPEYVRDHISRDKMDNRDCNLRWVPFAGNAQNKGPQKRNVVGVRGVTLFNGNRYRATVGLGGKRHYLGYFDSVADAEQAVIAHRKKILPFSVEAA